MILIFSSIYTLHQALPYDKIFKEILASLIHSLESTDAAGRVPQPRLTRLPTHWCRVWVFFFFFPQINADLARFVPTQLDSRRIGFDLRRIGLIWPELGRIGSYWPVAKTAETGWKWPKSALKLIRTAEILTLEVFLAFFFLCFVNQCIVMCFLRIF